MATTRNSFRATRALISMKCARSYEHRSKIMISVAVLFRVILQVADLDQAADFYSKLLGTNGRRIHRAERHYFDCGPVILALVDPKAHGGEQKPNEIGRASCRERV